MQRLPHAADHREALLPRPRRACSPPPTPERRAARRFRTASPPTCRKPVRPWPKTRAAVSCVGSALSTAQCSMTPSIDVFYTDVWTDTSQGLTANPSISYQYSALPTGEVAAHSRRPLPGCEGTWASNCRIVINYPEHIQPIWDQPRKVTALEGTVTADHTCTQGGCHSPTNAAGAAAQPAGNLDLSNTASNADPDELVSYVDLLFAAQHPRSARRQRQPDHGLRGAVSSMPATPTARTRAPRWRCSPPAAATASTRGSSRPMSCA